MFSINLKATTPVRATDETAFGTITIGDFTESFFADLSYWTDVQYLQSWRAALAVLDSKETATACLVTSITDPKTANFIASWPLYRIHNDVHIQNKMIFLDELEREFDENVPWRSVGPRETVNEDGIALSEWHCTIQDIREFIGQTESR